VLDIFSEALNILLQAAPYLVFGYLAAGLLSVFLGRYQRIGGLLTAPGSRPVWLAALLGVPLPLCSCSVLPTALTLRKQGASKGTTASFLISVPETDVISIVLTYALLGPVLAVYRPVAAVVTAVVTGLVVNRIDESVKKRKARVHADAPREAAACGSCHCAGSDEGVEDAFPKKQNHRGWLARALHFGFVEMFDDIMVQLLVGILIAGAVVAWLPSFGLEDIVAGSPLTYLVMLAIGIPVYVCATVSTPLAVGLIAGGVSPGAALVFLLAGPATNIASLIVLNSQFGGRALAGYLVSIGVVSVLLGVGLDVLMGPGYRPAVVEMVHHMHHDTSILQIASATLLLALAAVSIWRTRLLSRWARKIRTLFGGRPASQTD
jgi:uncharacterized membrane protein YraQ (UPF0718 family)